MIILQTIFFSAIMLLVCYLSGNLLCRILAIPNTFCFNILSGFILTLSLFQLIATPFMILHGNFTILVIIIISVQLSIIILSALTIIKTKSLKFPDFNMLKIRPFIWFIVLVLVLCQIILSTCLQHTDMDDSFYISASTTAINSNTVFGFNPSSGITSTPYPAQYGLVSWELFIAFLAKVFNIAPAVFAHTVIPPFLIFLAYFSIYNLSKRICKDSSAIPFFMLIFETMYLFGGYSEYTQSSFLLLRIWQGKAVLSNIIYYILIAVCIDIYKSVKFSNYKLWIYASLVMLAGICSSVMGNYIMPLLYLTVMLSLAFLIDIKAFIRSLLPLALSLLPVLFYAGYNLYKTYGYNSSNLNEHDTFFSILKQFCGPHYILALFFIASLIYVLFRGNRLHRSLFIISTVVIFLTFLNPIVGNYLLKKAAFSPVYWRLFWIVPFYSSIAYVLSDILSHIKNIEEYLITAAVFCFSVAIPGKLLYSRTQFEYAQNAYKLPQSTLDIANYIDKGKQDKNISVMLPDNLSYALRQYDANLITVWPRVLYLPYDFNGSELNDLHNFHDTLYSNKEISESYVYSCMKEFNIQYLVIPSNRPPFTHPAMEVNLVYKIKGFNIYLLNKYGV